MPVWIRPAQSADAEQVATVHVEAWRVGYRDLLPRVMLDRLDVVRRSAFFRDRIAEARGCFLVAERDGAIVGYCDIVPCRDDDADANTVAEIAAIYIQPQHWRTGIGRALCVDAFAWISEHDFQSVTLWVLATNRGAQRFYASMGFAPDGTTKTESISETIHLAEIRFRLEIPPK